MMAVTDMFLEDYDAAAEDVIRANYRNYSENLQRWFYVLDNGAASAEIVTDLENAVDAQKWYNDVMTNERETRRGKLQWALELRERLGIQLSFFRSIAERKIDAAQFGFHFFRQQGDNFDAVVVNINNQVFSPLVRDLRRHIVRVATPVADAQAEVPASDRTVRLDHNSRSYQDAIEAVDRLEELVRRANDYDDAEDKDEKLAELSAGRRLLQSVRVRVAAVAHVLAAPIRALTTRFATGLVNQAAHDLWDKLTTLLGSGWHWPF